MDPDYWKWGNPAPPSYWQHSQKLDPWPGQAPWQPAPRLTPDQLKAITRDHCITMTQHHLSNTVRIEAVLALSSNPEEDRVLVVDVSQETLTSYSSPALLQVVAQMARTTSDYLNTNGWPPYVLERLGVSSSQELAGSLTTWEPAPPSPPKDYVSGATVTRDLRRLLPGLSTRVPCPAAGCQAHADLENMVQHVNDQHRWTRAQIADWLESLDVDLTFPTEPPAEPEPVVADWTAPMEDIYKAIATAQAHYNQLMHYHLVGGPKSLVTEPYHHVEPVSPLEHKKLQAAHQNHLKVDPTKSKPKKN